MRYTPSGRPVTTFSVATNRSWTSTEGDRRTETEWFNIVTWGNLAEICKQHLTKGQLVYLEGRIQTRQWEDSEGNQRTTVEIVANDMVALSSRSEDTDIEDTEINESDEFPY
jgi:single-strand DNA-binding protein